MAHSRARQGVRAHGERVLCTAQKPVAHGHVLAVRKGTARAVRSGISSLIGDDGGAGEVEKWLI